ncbi:hypothetical protein AMECASPLE_027518 [Ameca splendens]|uniref:Uncharacterized protein n=1 Tax=Ameca splendens TaxID=208324 RepID=A0ABV0XIC8_9TELE
MAKITFRSTSCGTVIQHFKGRLFCFKCRHLVLLAEVRVKTMVRSKKLSEAFRNIVETYESDKGFTEISEKSGISHFHCMENRLQVEDIENTFNHAQIWLSTCSPESRTQDAKRTLQKP